MLACILNMNPENLFSLGFIILSSLILSIGAGAIEIKQFNNSFTPKLFNAEPKKTGC